MSSHFSGTEETEAKTSWRRYFRLGWRPETEAEIRYFKHAKMRAGLFMVYLVGFCYFNPEYSYTMTWINKKLKERRDAQEAEAALRVTQPAAPVERHES